MPRRFLTLVQVNARRSVMKLIYHSGETVPHGAYWNISSGELVHQDGASGVLDGDSMSYLKVHPIALLLLGPIFGLAFVMFLPVIGFIMVASAIVSKLVTFVGRQLALEAGFRWQPTMAYFTGKKTSKEKAPEKAPKKS
jgi:hypothetical protein